MVKQAGNTLDTFPGAAGPGYGIFRLFVTYLFVCALSDRYLISARMAHTMELYKIPFLIAALLVAYAIPDLAYSFVLYKCKKNDWEAPPKRKGFFWYAACIAAECVCAAVALWFMDMIPAAFCIVFSLFAIFGTLVDSYIRIIANEMLLVMLPIGLAYRIVKGGFSSLLGSLIALGVVIAVFALAMLATKLLKGAVGVGMGDIKLAMVIALAVGWPDVLLFLGGMAVAIGVYCAIGLATRVLQKNSYFPMAGMIMAGLMLALLAPYLIYLL